MARGGGELVKLAEVIGEGLPAAGSPPPQLHALARGLALQGMTAELVGAVFTEARAKRPKAARVDGLLFLLGDAVAELRLRGNGGSTAAKRELEAVMALIGAEAAKGGAKPGILMALARELALAGAAPPAALQEAMAAGMEAIAPPPAASTHEKQARFDAIALEMGDDPFRIHAELAAMAMAFPVEQRLGLIYNLGFSAAPPVRAAGLGFVLDPDERCALAALAAAHEAAQKVRPSAINVARLVHMRPWLAPARRAAADDLIAFLRRKSQAPEARARGEVRHWLATPADGAGAQSLFAIVKDGKMWAVASVLIKHAEGVCDAWVGDGMSKREADGLMRQIVEEAEAVEVTGEFFAQRLGDALAANAGAAPPPFGFVQVLETVGAGPLPPRAISPEDLCEALLAGLPADQVGAEVVARAHAGASRWGERISTVDTWFEADEAVEALLRPIRGRKKRAAAVLTEILPHRRDFWAGRVVWTAATLQAKAGLDPVLTSLWIDMALVARTIACGAPLADIPLMRQIADDTVRVFEGRNF